MAQSCVIPGGVPVILGAITIDSYMIPMNIFASLSSSEKVHQSINQSNCIMSASNNGSFEQVSANWNTQYNTASFIVFHIVKGLKALICAYKPLSQ